MKTFAERFPYLFHVTLAVAVPSIRAMGVLSAAALALSHGIADPGVLARNRDAWTPIGPHMLRRQGMSDRALRPRLDPALTPERWRAMINGFVFLFPAEAAARRFVRAEPGREQAILRFATADFAASGLLRFCRYNNGYIDRRSLPQARRRTRDDYQPIAVWRGGPAPKEVVTEHVPPGIDFEVLPPA